MFDLNGKTALVTGAGRNVGREIARLLAAQGAAVAINDLYGERAEEVAKAIHAEGGRALAAAGDVTSERSVQDFVGHAEKELGSIDILVNNAGLPVGGDFVMKEFHELEPATWQPWLDVSLYGVFHCSRAVLPRMRERGWGRIVTIVSDAGLTGVPRLAPYAAAKAGAMGFTRTLAQENGRHGITCNCVSLGMIERPDLDPDFPLDKFLRGYAIPRPGKPSDVAPAILYLASEEASWVTGQVFAVNGGANSVR